MVVLNEMFHYRYFVDDCSATTLHRVETVRKAAIFGSCSSDVTIDVENCYHLIVEASCKDEFEKLYYEPLSWLISENFSCKGLRKQSRFLNESEVIEIGPRYHFLPSLSAR